MKWQMDQESILKEMNDPRKILTIGRILSFKEVMKSNKKTKSSKKKNRLEQEKQLFYKIDEDGKKLFMRPDDIAKNNL